MDFDELYQKYADTVYGFLMFKLRDQYLVEDIIQETFLAIYQGIEKSNHISSPKAWVLSIAHKKMVDYFRKNQLKEEMLNGAELPQAVGNSSSNLFLNEVLGQVDEIARTILYGLYVEGLTCRELGLILSIPEGTVKSRAFYARKKLCHWLREGSK